MHPTKVHPPKVEFHQWAPYTNPMPGPASSTRVHVSSPLQPPLPAPLWVLFHHDPHAADNRTVNPPWQWNRPPPEAL